MRKPRIKNDGEGYYHIVSRCALLLSSEGKSVFVDMLRRIAIFSGIELLNYCVMDNHSHILAHVPIPTEITEKMLIYRVKTLYGANQAQSLKDRWIMYRHGNHLKRLEEEQMMLKRRMGDITPFIQNLKQCFSIWDPALNPNINSMWEVLSHITLLEDTTHTLSTVSAYIDLNPVRAGILDDPKYYKWSGYASALRGDSNAMHGIARIYDPDAKVSDFKKHIETYSQKLYLSGIDVFPAEMIQDIIDKNGELPPQILNLVDDFDHDSGRLDGEDMQGPDDTPDCDDSYNDWYDSYDDWDYTPDWKEESGWNDVYGCDVEASDIIEFGD